MKIQYPGVAEALGADLAHLNVVAPLVGLGAPRLDPRALFEQLGDRLREELDYQHEADVQRAFARAFEDDDDFVIPDVIAAAAGVLVTEWVGGTPLAAVIAAGDATVRDQAASRLLRLLLSSPSRTGIIHGDPHPGNFRLLDDGRLVVLDFGSSESIAGGWPPALGRLLRAGRDRDAERLHHEVVTAGLLAFGDAMPGQLLEILEPWLEPLRVKSFHFERSWLQREVRTWSNPRSRAARLQRKVYVPTRYLLVQRVAFGLLGVLTSLDATVPVRAECERWLPELR